MHAAPSHSNSTHVAPPQKVCLNNGTLKDGICECDKRFQGPNCETSVCQNYCVNGTCEVNADGKPVCRCQSGRTGVRCETDKCQGLCLNDGECAIDDSNEAFCKCPDGFQGQRCEISSNLLTGLCRPYCLYNERVKRRYLNSDSKHEPQNSIFFDKICR